MKHTEQDRLFAELSMKITSNRATWMLRCWILANMLKGRGVDVERILQENDNQKLADLLTDTIRRNEQEQHGD